MQSDPPLTLTLLCMLPPVLFTVFSAGCCTHDGVRYASNCLRVRESRSTVMVAALWFTKTVSIAANTINQSIHSGPVPQPPPSIWKRLEFSRALQFWSLIERGIDFHAPCTSESNKHRFSWHIGAAGFHENLCLLTVVNGLTDRSILLFFKRESADLTLWLLVALWPRWFLQESSWQKALQTTKGLTSQFSRAKRSHQNLCLLLFENQSHLHFFSIGGSLWGLNLWLGQGLARPLVSGVYPNHQSYHCTVSPRFSELNLTISNCPLKNANIFSVQGCPLILLQKANRMWQFPSFTFLL